MLTHVKQMLHNGLLRRYQPLSIVHFVSERCNARCAHCFIDFVSPLDSASELTLDEIERLTRTTGQSLYNVNITGGEPFIRDDLFEIIKCYIDNTPVRSIVITSNGWFCDAISDLIERYRKLDTPCTLTLSISIDSFEEEHDAGRGLSGLYRRAIRSYRSAAACQDPRICADVALTVTDRNASSIAEIYHHLKREGVGSISPVLLREEGVQDLLPDRQALARAYRELTRLTDGRIENGRAGVVNAVHRAKNRISHHVLYEMCRNPRFLSYCRAGALFAVIAADGSVSPCEILSRRMPLGNLRDNDMNLLRILENNLAEGARNTIRQSRCHCTFECAWTVNIATSPKYWPGLMIKTLKELA